MSTGLLPVDYQPTGFIRNMLLVARKDLVIEFRTRSAFLAAGVFSLLSVAIFKFTWGPASVASIDVAPGVLWVIFTFSGLLGLHRSFGVELADRALDALLASPMSRESVFAGKALANLAFVACVQAMTIPAIALFFDLPSGRFWYLVVAASVLASVGLTAIGTLFAAVTANTRLAELLLPMLALPFFIPVVIPAAQATSLLLSGRPFDEVWGWLKLLLAFDLIFVSASIVAFPYTLEE